VEIVRSLISNGSLQVTDLVDHLAVPAQRLRHHLAMLCEQALVSRERPGRVATYRITDDAVAELLATLSNLAVDHGR
jgi:DNA-binding transcriptional ArsR family regulator